MTLISEPLLAPTHPLTFIDPERIRIERLSIEAMVDLQARTSKAVWRPAPGRKSGFGVIHEDRLIGLMFLSSPVINLGVRDEFLGLSGDGKGFALRRVADLSVCVGLQPLAWHWNVGKLVAMLAQSDEIAAAHERKHGDPLSWITTTSLYGRGAQYNRVYKFLGYTKGYGHQHISDAEYAEMLRWLKRNNVPIPSSRFGAGSNPRMRRIAAYQRARGESANLMHGNRRGVYIAPAGQGDVQSIAHRWHARWGLPRWQRTADLTAPYFNGLADAA